MRPPLNERMAAWQQAFSIYNPTTGQRVLNVDEIRAIERFGVAGEPSNGHLTAVDVDA